MSVQKVEKKQFIIDGELLFGRRCSKCLFNKPFSEFGTNNSSKFGVTPHCFDCSGYKTRRGRHIPLETIVMDGKEVTLKTCRRCEQKKTIDQFHNNKDGSGGVFAECKNCLSARVREDKKKMPRSRIREYQTTARIKENINGRRKNFEKDLPKLLKVAELRTIKEKFPTCALTNLPDPELEHFIPNGIGHGGNYIGNIYRLNRSLNISKHVKNPFNWKKEVQNESWFKEDKWKKLIEYLANENGLTVSEFELFVNWCFDNPRSRKDMKDNLQKGIIYNSLEEWKNTIKGIG